MVTRLEKTSEVITASPPLSPPLAPSYPLLSELPYADLSALPPLISKEELVESKGKDKDSPKVIATPFKEKPALTYTPLD